MIGEGVSSSSRRRRALAAAVYKSVVVSSQRRHIYEKRLEHEDCTMNGGRESRSVVESSLSLCTYVVSPFPSFSKKKKKKKKKSFRVLKE